MDRKNEKGDGEGGEVPISRVNLGESLQSAAATRRKGLKAGLETVEMRTGERLTAPTPLSLVPSFSEKLRYI